MSYFSSLEKYAQLNGFRKYIWGEIVLYHNQDFVAKH